MPTIGLFVLIANERTTRNIDPAQSLRYFSWALFVVIAVVYSAFVFWLEFAKDGPFIFSRNNVRTRSQVLLAHAMFLTILLCCYRICTYMIPTLPFWITDTFRPTSRAKTSFAEIVFVSARWEWPTLSANGCTGNELIREIEFRSNHRLL